MSRPLGANHQVYDESAACVYCETHSIAYTDVEFWIGLFCKISTCGLSLYRPALIHKLASPSPFAKFITSIA